MFAMPYKGNGYITEREAIVPGFRAIPLFVHASPVGAHTGRAKGGEQLTDIKNRKVKRLQLHVRVKRGLAPLSSPSPCSNRSLPVTAQQMPADGPNQELKPIFRRGDDNSVTRTSFFDEPPAEDQLAVGNDSDQERANILTPNTRLLLQVRDTMERLGVNSDQPTPLPLTRETPDFSKINPLSAFAGSAGAALISVIVWRLLNATARFAATHPLDEQIYIVQRLAVVVRTCLVCLFALGSGISGVTSLGLLLLAFRTSYAVIAPESSTKTNPETTSDEQSNDINEAQ